MLAFARYAGMSAIGRAIMSPLDAVSELKKEIVDLANTAVSFDITSNDYAKEARRELFGLRTAADNANEKKAAKKEAEKIKENSKTPKEIANEKKAKINKLQRSGALSKEEADKARTRVDAEAGADPFTDKVKALELEILALQKGETAAERKRLADEGLTSVQIRQIEILKKQKEAIEAVHAAQQKAEQRRSDKLFQLSDEAINKGANPAEVYKKVMAQIDRDQKSGKLSEGTANDARETARGNLDDRMDSLKAEGRALAESMQTPFEKIRAQFANVAKLEAGGHVSKETADRAKAQLRIDIAEEKKRNEDKANGQAASLEETRHQVGPTGTFSAAAAMVIGGGPRFEVETLKATKQVASGVAAIQKNTNRIKPGGFVS